ncbi:MAG: TrkH family potassium uptake protein [Alphaproteobacteria bacterium]|nr:TrkH family potassium uptake protein [Alphaproteobacteria bacterium]
MRERKATSSIQTLLFVVGLFITTLSLAMIAPALLDWFYDDINWTAFATAMPITAFSGLLLVFAYRPARQAEPLSLKDTFLLTVSSWVFISFYAALPFIFSNSTSSHTDSFFEAISGLTTTGATVMTGIDYASPGVVLWRAVLQWLGGIGIVVMALTIMPMLRIGGMQLFRSEFSDRSEKVLPKVSQIAASLFTVYAGLTVLCAILLMLCDISPLEAICHAFSTVSTGGYSTSHASIAYFNNVAVELILMIFMIFGSITLLLFVRVAKGDPKALVKDTQVRTFLFITLISIIAITLWRYFNGIPFLKSLREVSFNLISIITSTGFSTTDYTLWGSFPLMTIFVLMQIGGCTGSTSGGIKVLRYQIVTAMIKAQLAQIRRPHGIFIPRYNAKPIPEGVFASVFTFLGLYLLSLGALTLGLALYNLDFVTCVSAAVATLNNVGPGFGHLVGPLENFSELPDGAKWLLMAGMLLGRLEFVTVFVLLSPRFWKT